MSERAYTKGDAWRHFEAHFVWNNEDGVILRARNESEAARCRYGVLVIEDGKGRLADCTRAGVNRLFDYEDDVSGGLPICEEHTAQHQREMAPRASWVSQDAYNAWMGSEDTGGGWGSLWYLFAPEGAYSAFIAPPHLNKDETWNNGTPNPEWPGYENA